MQRTLGTLNSAVTSGLLDSRSTRLSINLHHLHVIIYSYLSVLHAVRDVAAHPARARLLSRGGRSTIRDCVIAIAAAPSPPPHRPRATRRDASRDSGTMAYRARRGLRGEACRLRAGNLLGDASRIQAPQSPERTRSRKVILRTVYTGGSAVVRRGSRRGYQRKSITRTLWRRIGQLPRPQPQQPPPRLSGPAFHRLSASLVAPFRAEKSH